MIKFNKKQSASRQRGQGMSNELAGKTSAQEITAAQTSAQKATTAAQKTQDMGTYGQQQQ